MPGPPDPATGQSIRPTVHQPLLELPRDAPAYTPTVAGATAPPGRPRPSRRARHPVRTPQVRVRRAVGKFRHAYPGRSRLRYDRSAVHALFVIVLHAEGAMPL